MLRHSKLNWREKFKAPRSLSDAAIAHIIHAVIPYKGVRFRILTYPEDAESVGIAERIGQSIRDRAGWTLVPWERGTMIVGIVTGIQVFVSQDASDKQQKAAAALVAAISAEGLAIELRRDQTYKDEMMIRVGKKP